MTNPNRRLGEELAQGTLLDDPGFLRKGVAGDWKGAFTERDKQVFKEVAGNLLIKLGYEKDNYW